MSERPVIRKPWERVREVWTPDRSNESETDRSAGNDTDVNRIVERFSRTGVMPEGQNGPGQFVDVTSLQGDLAEMISKGKTAMDQLKEHQQKQADLHQEELDKKLARLEELEKAEKLRKEVPQNE